MLRLKTIELGYTLPEKLSKKMKLDNLRVYASGYNLFTWSSTDLLDTEARSGHYVLYPIQRIINAGISVTF